MLGEFLIHTTTVEPLLGHSGRGQVFGPPVVLSCLVEDEARLVRTDTGAEQLASTAVIYPTGTVLPVGSRVTLDSGRVTTVLTSARRDDGGLTGLAHVEVTLR